jgi:2-polyprenyl-6-methoxyphenol hydroxylase-like FAD-dependent oxidoreductase
MTERFDALVIGGGPAGAATSLLLARAGWRVALVERKCFPRRKVCGEYLSATSLPLLDRLGLGEVFRDLAGPPVRQVGLFAGSRCLVADLPRPSGQAEWGRALSREQLDTLLLRAAAGAGVEVRQPASVVTLASEGDGAGGQWEELDGQRKEWRAAIVVAAHGSWEGGPLPTQPSRRPLSPADLLAFKAHFADSNLPAGLMPLLAFPGGYGGMVHCDGSRVSLSCCIRRDQLNSLRRGARPAGEFVLEHILTMCSGARKALASAKREADWLAAGPIQPGIRLPGAGAIFAVGNCAGEAHPVVAEGISMALQGAWLLAERLCAWRREGCSRRDMPAVQQDYAAAWRRHFGPRLFAAAAIAHWAMRPAAVGGTLPLLGRFPHLLTWGARLSGKASRII